MPPLLDAYAQARAAETLGASQRAVQGYQQVLTAAPDNEMFAARALTQAITAGDFPLALKAARVLERSSDIAPDARFLLLVDAIRAKDWKRARRHSDAIADDQVFAFMAPVLRAWIARGSGKGDPLAELAAGASDPLVIPFVAEHRPLLLMAAGREKDALEELARLSEAGDDRAWRLRMSAAATLVKRGSRDQALALLDGEEGPLAGARRLVEAGEPLPGEIATASEGLAEYLLGLALDLHRQEVSSLALSFARLATFLAPGSSEARLLTGELLAIEGHSSAEAMLGTIKISDPFGDAALDARIRLLTAAGEQNMALREAEAATRARVAGASDWARLGDVYGQLGRHDESAEAYARALEVAKADGAPQPEWILRLLHGGALEQADRWSEAKAALEAAYALAPEQPLVLNYLGYSQLERRENIDHAEALISKASRLEPNSPQITDSLGWARFLQGDVATAVKLLERAVQGDPTDPAINEHLGDAYYSAGRRFEARFAWRAALSTADGKDAERLQAKIEAGLIPDLASP